MDDVKVKTLNYLAILCNVYAFVLNKLRDTITSIRWTVIFGQSSFFSLLDSLKCSSQPHSPEI